MVEQVVPEKPGARDRTDVDQYVVHTFWGARVNRPWAYALAQAWEDRYGYALETYPGDDQILILVPPEADWDEALSLVTPANLEDLLRRRLEATGFFGARFREGAGRALLLPKPGFDKRVPLWQTRLRSKRLFEAVAKFPEFPILLEAWRQCLNDEFELDALRVLLEERSAGRIETRTCRTTEPSPFTEGLLWRQINEKMYAGDDPPAHRPSAPEGGLWEQLVGADRPRLPRRLVADWESRWGRTAPGYAPETASDLADHLEVRVALSPREWEDLLDACSRDSGRPREEWDQAVEVVRREGRVCLPRLAAVGTELESIGLRWLEGRGPVEIAVMAAFWGQSSADTEAWALAQAAQGTVLLGALTDDSTGPQVCLTRTWDQMVRRLRINRRSSVPVRPISELPLFLGQWQGLTTPTSPGTELIEDRVGQLLGFPLAADLWEGAVLPSRLCPYRSVDFDRLFLEGGMRWIGVGAAKVVLGFPEDWATFLAEALSPATAAGDRAEESAERIFGTSPGSSERAFTDLAASSGLSTGALTEALWSLAWKGLASATTFGPLRQGLKSGFRFEPGTELNRPSARGFQRWASLRSHSGSWRRWTPQETIPPRRTPLEELEEDKRRARLVLDRYGIVFKALLSHECPALQWKSLFPALRLMELSGEISGGMFWDGLPGLQFATPDALRSLENGSGPPTLWIQHAQDPSSLCGLGLDALSGLPRRATGTWLWWRGTELVGVLTAAGKKLDLFLRPADDELEVLVKRSAEVLLTDGKTHWALETVDGTPASEHPASGAFRRTGFRPHGEKLLYWRNPG